MTIRCHSLSFIVTRGHLGSLVVPRCNLLSLVVSCFTTGCHLLYQSLSLNISLVCLFINGCILCIISCDFVNYRFILNLHLVPILLKKKICFLVFCDFCLFCELEVSLDYDYRFFIKFL